MQNSAKQGLLSPKDLSELGIIANDFLSEFDLKTAQNILNQIHIKTQNAINKGTGPFYAEIYDNKGALVSSASNSVTIDNISTRHAEMNVIEAVHRKFNSYDLGKFDLTIYINAEPCIMCMGALMWSGIRRIFYSVPSKDVEQITGFDEGYKPNWQTEFKKRGISVYGGISADSGMEVLKQYVLLGKNIYKPTR